MKKFFVLYLIITFSAIKASQNNLFFNNKKNNETQNIKKANRFLQKIKNERKTQTNEKNDNVTVSKEKSYEKYLSIVKSKHKKKAEDLLKNFYKETKVIQEEEEEEEEGKKDKKNKQKKKRDQKIISFKEILDDIINTNLNKKTLINFIIQSFLSIALKANKEIDKEELKNFFQDILIPLRWNMESFILPYLNEKKEKNELEEELTEILLRIKQSDFIIKKEETTEIINKLTTEVTHKKHYVNSITRYLAHIKYKEMDKIYESIYKDEQKTLFKHILHDNNKNILIHLLETIVEANKEGKIPLTSEKTGFFGNPTYYDIQNNAVYFLSCLIKEYEYKTKIPLKKSFFYNSIQEVLSNMIIEEKEKKTTDQILNYVNNKKAVAVYRNYNETDPFTSFYVFDKEGNLIDRITAFKQQEMKEIKKNLSKREARR